MVKHAEQLIILAKQVSYIRGSRYILKDINWSVKPGEHWAILGLNGSGKTTLLNMINGYIFPSNGELQVLGKTFGKYDLRELRKSIGWVSSALQERLYKNETVEDIVLSGKFATLGLFDNPEKQDREQVHKILELFGISALSGQTYSTLSQGEKQRVLIARALMASPRLLILDEPCAGLDIFAKAKLLATIESMANKSDAPTILYVTHHTEEILPAFGHTLLIRRGMIHSSGKTNSVLTEKNLSDFFETPIHLEKTKSSLILRVRD